MTKDELRAYVFRRNLERFAISEPVTEYRFHPTRRWRFDYAWPDARLALEVDGGVWVGGKHGRGSGIVKDHEKRNAAAVLGWRVLLVTPRDLPKLATALMVKEAMKVQVMAA